MLLDDATLAALNDRVRRPDHLRHIVTGHEPTTRANGGTPSADDARIVSYLCVMIDVLTRLGFEISISKTQSGSIIVTIGFCRYL